MERTTDPRGATGRGEIAGGRDLGMRAPYEGEVTRRIERETSRAPSLVYLVAAGVSVLGSLALMAMRRPLSAIFVGLWPPTFLLLGNYNKMVKLARGGQERYLQAGMGAGM